MPLQGRVSPMSFGSQSGLIGLYLSLLNGGLFLRMNCMFDTRIRRMKDTFGIIFASAILVISASAIEPTPEPLILQGTQIQKKIDSCTR